MSKCFERLGQCAVDEQSDIRVFVVVSCISRRLSWASQKPNPLAHAGHDLISARRTADVVRPRQIAMFLAKNLTPNSLPVIGRKFGGRDHTTVLHAVRKIEALWSRDSNLAGDLDAIARALAALA